MTIKEMYAKLRALGATEIGACAMLGNIRAESDFKSNAVEAARSTCHGWSNETYTAAVDNGTYTKEAFCNDRTGYGLVQWTYPSRKEALLQFAKAQKVSIGDANMQLEFLAKEIKNYTTPSWAFYGKEGKDWTKDLEECTKVIMLKFECPGNQSELNQQKRVKYAKDVYAECVEGVDTVILTKSIPVYNTADDAIKGTNRVAMYCTGKYFIYKKYKTATNITKIKGTPGAWVVLP